MKSEDEEFLVKVDDDVYGPISLERLTADVQNGKLTDLAKVWDGEDWVPISIVIGEDGWDGDDWDEKYGGKVRFENWLRNERRFAIQTF